MPSISIIIPAYNVEEYVEECLDSILNQTFNDYEVIVVDDCSTDNTYSIIESYIPKFNNKLTLLKTDKNSGTCSIPRNIGLHHAKGDYIYFLDSDDYIANNALEILYNTAKEYNADVVYCSTYYYIIFGKILTIKDTIGRKRISQNIADKTEILTNKDIFLDNTMLSHTFFYLVWLKFINRKFLIDNNITFYPILAEDLIWSIEIFARAKTVVRIIEPVYYYRIHNGSITQRRIITKDDFIEDTKGFLKQLKCVYDLCEKIDYFKQNSYYSKKFLEFYWIPYLRRSKNILKQYNDSLYEIYLSILADKEDKYNKVIAFFMTLLISRYIT